MVIQNRVSAFRKNQNFPDVIAERPKPQVKIASQQKASNKNSSFGYGIMMIVPNEESE